MFMDFKKYLPSDSINGKAEICLKEGSTLEDLLKTLGIPVNQPRIIVINGYPREYRLKWVSRY